MSKSRTTVLMLTSLALTGVGLGPRLVAAEPQTHLLPQAIQNEHRGTLEQLTELAARPAPVGPQAAKVLAMLKQHMAKEEAYILPPLSLLPALADGKVTANMAWALPMTERVRAEREQLFAEHVAITDALNELVVAADAANDQDAREFAENAAADSLADQEILEPAILLIGDTLRSKLPPAR